MKHALTLAVVAGSILLLNVGAVAQAQTPPAGLRPGPDPACGYRTGSRTLTSLPTYRSAEGRVTTYVQHQGRPVDWSSLGFADARQRPWYVNSTPIAFRGGQYGKYGLPRIVSPSDLRWVGEHDGQGLFAEMGATDFPVIYVIAKGLDCEFQAYMRQ